MSQRTTSAAAVTTTALAGWSVFGRTVNPSVWIAGTLFGLTVLLTIVAELLVVTGLSAYPTPSDALADASTGLTAMTYALVGALILSRRANAIGALLLGIGVVGAALAATASYASHLALPPPPVPATLSELAAAGWVFVVGGLAWLSSVVLVVLLVQLFPDGRPLAPRWRALLWLTLLWPVLFELVTEFAPLTDASGQAINPHGLTGPLADGLVIARAAIGGSALLILILSTASAVFRFRRARGTERAQLEWFAYGTAVAVGAFVVTGQLPLGSVGNVINSVLLCVIPVSIGIAILRDRLYDIELLIRRSVSYGATSATVGLAFFAAIVVLQALLRPLTGGSEAAVAVSTLVGFALFQPIRRRIQDAVDRRFDRSRYDAARTLDRFSDRLGDEVDLDALRSELLGVVGETMAPAQASLWLRPPAR